MLYIFTVEVEGYLQNNIFVEFMPLEGICMFVTVPLLTLTTLYKKSVPIVKCSIILYTPMFNNILSKIAL